MIEVPESNSAARMSGRYGSPGGRTEFHKYMSGIMDKQVEGAIGGNALRHFVMTVDYPRATAYFRCVKDCRKN